jgi:hypothetical protein
LLDLSNTLYSALNSYIFVNFSRGCGFHGIGVSVTGSSDSADFEYLKRDKEGVLSRSKLKMSALFLKYSDANKCT